MKWRKTPWCIPLVIFYQRLLRIYPFSMCFYVHVLWLHNFCIYLFWKLHPNSSCAPVLTSAPVFLRFSHFHAFRDGKAVAKIHDIAMNNVQNNSLGIQLTFTPWHFVTVRTKNNKFDRLTDHKKCLMWRLPPLAYHHTKIAFMH